MPAKSPEEICHLFKQYMAEGDLDSVLSVYDPEAVVGMYSRQLRPESVHRRQGTMVEIEESLVLPRVSG
jgi:hypothetical protein